MNAPAQGTAKAAPGTRPLDSTHAIADVDHACTPLRSRPAALWANGSRTASFGEQICVIAALKLAAELSFPHSGPASPARAQAPAGT